MKASPYNLLGRYNDDAAGPGAAATRALAAREADYGAFRVPGLRNVRQLEVSKLFDPSLIDEILEVDYELAYTRALELFQAEGLRAGPSSGLIHEGARRVVERDRTGFGVMIFPDDVFKYTANMVKHIPSLAEGTRP